MKNFKFMKYVLLLMKANFKSCLLINVPNTPIKDKFVTISVFSCFVVVKLPNSKQQPLYAIFVKLEQRMLKISNI